METKKKVVKKKAVKNDNSAKIKQMERDLERSYFRNSKKMEIEFTKFEYKYSKEESEHFYSPTYGDHTFVGLAVWHEMIIKEENKVEKYQIDYQNGQSYLCNDYNLPSNELELHEHEYNTFITAINNLEWDDFYNTTFITEFLQENGTAIINTMPKLYQVFAALKKNKPAFRTWILDNELEFKEQEK